MKKTILTIAAAAALLVFSAIGVSAAEETPLTAVEPVEGSYTVTYNVGKPNAGSMYGMVAITGNTITEDSIVYIDQATADANGDITFSNFIPKVAPGENGFEESTVYIGGPGLDTETAKAIAVLMDEKPAGVAVSGKVKSYNPKLATTIKLMQGEAEAATTTIAAEATGSGQVEQSFTIETVAAGTYNLVVSKAGHLDYTITNVVVGTEALDLTTSANTNVSVMTLITGDVNGDTKVNGTDVIDISKSENFNAELADAVNKLADVNGDDKVNGSDLIVVNSDVNFNKDTANSTFAY